jgi:hypothetical protein
VARLREITATKTKRNSVPIFMMEPPCDGIGTFRPRSAGNRKPPVA